MSKKINTFPQTLFVKTEEDSGTVYFVADEDRACLAEQGEKIRVATYKLVEVCNVELVPKISK